MIFNQPLPKKVYPEGRPSDTGEVRSEVTPLVDDISAYRYSIESKTNKDKKC